MFAQSGVYLMDDQRSMAFPCKDSGGRFEMRFFVAMFKGNEPHCGFPPILDPNFDQSVDGAKIDRMGFVCYLSKKAIERAESKMAVFPPGSFFGSTVDAVSAQPPQTSKCSSVDFLVSQPSREEHIRYHLQESLLHLNFCANALGVQLDRAVLENIAQNAKCVDSEGAWAPLALALLKLHIGTTVPELRAYLQWYIEHSEVSNLSVQRQVVKANRRLKNPLRPLENAVEICGAIDTAMTLPDSSWASRKVEEISEIVSIQWVKQTHLVSVLFNSGNIPAHGRLNLFPS
jgi:hypothetical protein